MIRSERDRRVDEILSGTSRSSTPERYRDDPSPPSSTSSFSGNNCETGDSMKLKTNLVSFGDSMKHKFEGLFGSTKTGQPSSTVKNSTSPASSPQSPQQNGSSSPPTSIGSRRVFGRPVINENHRPYSRNIVNQNGHDSPNPFLTAGINRQQNNTDVSPFSRLDDRRTPAAATRSIFDDI